MVPHSQSPLLYLHSAVLQGTRVPKRLVAEYSRDLNQLTSSKSMGEYQVGGGLPGTTG